MKTAIVEDIVRWRMGSDAADEFAVAEAGIQIWFVENKSLRICPIDFSPWSAVDHCERHGQRRPWDDARCRNCDVHARAN